jgi:hypothetical protein
MPYSCLFIAAWLLSTYSIKLLSYTIITIYKSLSYILVSLLDTKPKVVAAVDSVVTACLGSIVLTYYFTITLVVII